MCILHCKCASAVTGVLTRESSTGSASNSHIDSEAMDASEVKFDINGLVPCIVQDWTSGEVLTLAYMNAEALALTQETGEMHFYSRSREELWHKGATSGNTQAVKSLRYDCDGDAVLALVDTGGGPACHTGERTCFYRGDLDM